MRPTSYLKIDNFYTATIYEKGAELIGVLKALVGEPAFKAGMDLYFERCDGQAVTMEDFVACFAEASGRDLSQHFRWYETPGTPELKVGGDLRRGEEGPVADLHAVGAAWRRAAPHSRSSLGLLDEHGAVQTFSLPGANAPVRREPPSPWMATRLTVDLTGVERLPVLSALRGFSAPVKLYRG